MGLASNRTRLLTLAAVVLFIAGTAVIVATFGLELSSDWLFVWLLSACLHSR